MWDIHVPKMLLLAMQITILIPQITVVAANSFIIKYKNTLCMRMEYTGFRKRFFLSLANFLSEELFPWLILFYVFHSWPRRALGSFLPAEPCVSACVSEWVRQSFLLSHPPFHIMVAITLHLYNIETIKTHNLYILLHHKLWLWLGYFCKIQLTK